MNLEGVIATYMPPCAYKAVYTEQESRKYILIWKSNQRFQKHKSKVDDMNKNSYRLTKKTKVHG